MTDEKHQQTRYAVGPICAIATVPAEFISSAMFEVVQGAYHLGDGVRRIIGRLRHR